MSRILEWIKSNLVIVIALVLVIAAMVGMPIVASSMNEEVKKEVNKRANKKKELDQIQTSVTPPGSNEAQSVLVNQTLLDQYSSITDAITDDAERVYTAALEHNQKKRTVLQAGGEKVFPKMAEYKKEVLPKRFHESLMQAYRELFAEVQAGDPPDEFELKKEINRQREKFIAQAAKESEDELTEEERNTLEGRLTDVRMARYREAAEKIKFYANLETIHPPEWQTDYMPSPAEMFLWQWQFWICEDVMHALAGANAQSTSVLSAPVKQLLNVSIAGLPTIGRSSSTGTGGFGGGGVRGGGLGGGGLGGGSTSGGRSSESSDPKTGSAPNPTADVPLDFGVSLTGRKTNALYDVLHINLEVVAETNRIPEIINALSQQNFITILDIDLQPVDVYQELKLGFRYGKEPVSLLTLEIELIWLRPWVIPFMPDDFKTAIGIPLDAPKTNNG